MNFQATYNQQDYLHFLRDQFLPEDYEQHNEPVDIDFQSKYFQKITFLGKSNSLDLGVYEIRHSSENDARVGLSRDSFKLISRYYHNNALILFVPENASNYRLSLVTIDPKLDEKGIKVLKEFSNPRRYSYFLGEGAKIHTPEQYLVNLGRITDIEDLKKRFSVEVVNKDFYNKIADMFSKLVGGKRKRGSKTMNYDPMLALPSYSIKTHEQKYKEFAVRLIGRTVFCWFLKKKKSENDVPLIPEEVLSIGAVNNYPDYYHTRVEPLFFEVLNTKASKRKKEYHIEPYESIPFLNGGLFEPHYEDYYHSGKPNYALKVPDTWWKEFVEILEIYNFTIDENTSIDIDLSVDPEMLGRIFENLLAEINPETGETARKSTGSYYTPRPIVEYMVDESIKQHIITKTGLSEEKIAPLLDYSIEESGLTGEEENQVKAALDDIKVLDPACGSGAFPMGVLQKMLLVLQKVDYSAENSILNVLKDIKNPVHRKLIENKLTQDDDLDDYARKLNIIQRSIYGIDIQPIAVEISKLRFFLSLIVDEKIQDNQSNRGIEPLPNLEFKFACANTLIPLPEDTDLFDGANMDDIEKLEKLREEYFISFGEDKKKLQKEFKQTQNQMFTKSINLFNRDMGEHNLDKPTQSSLLATWNPFSDESTPWFDAKWMFGADDGFDVVIGNPPYIRPHKINLNDKKSLWALYKSYLKKTDIYVCFAEKSINLLKDEGSMCFIISNAFLRLDSFEEFRKLLLNGTSIKRIIEFNKDIFESAKVKTSVIIVNKKSNINNIVQTSITDQIHRLKELSINQIHQRKLINNYKYVFDLSSNEIADSLKEKMHGNSKLLGEIFKISFGLKTGDDSKFLTYTNCKPEHKKLLRGKDIGRYSYKYAGEYVWYVPDLMRKHKKTARPGSIERFEQPKVLIRDTGNGLMGTYDRSNYYVKDVLIIEPTGYSENVLKAVIGILNSKLMSFYYNTTFPTLHVQRDELSVLPINNEIFTANLQFVLADNVTQIISSNNDLVKGSNILDNQIDLIVYKIYELTYDEVLVVDPEFGMSKGEYEVFEISEVESSKTV